MTPTPKETARVQGEPAKTNKLHGNCILLAAFVARALGLPALAAWIDLQCAARKRREVEHDA